MRKGRAVGNQIAILATLLKRHSAPASNQGNIIKAISITRLAKQIIKTIHSQQTASQRLSSNPLILLKFLFYACAASNIPFIYLLVVFTVYTLSSHFAMLTGQGCVSITLNACPASTAEVALFGTEKDL